MSSFKRANIVESAAEGNPPQSLTGQHTVNNFDEPSWKLAGVVGPGEETQSLREAALVRKADETYALLAAIVESSDDAIFSCDLNGSITSWNKSAERIFGYTQNEMIGRPTSVLAPPHAPEDSALVLEQIRRGYRVDHYETIRHHQDGSDVVVSLSVSPLRDFTGSIIGASKVARDITGTKRAEQALRNADKLALAGRMAASIAHEINNPLEAITNLLFLLEHEEISEQGRRYLTLAQHELTRVSHIASQTLGFFRGAPGSAAHPLQDILDSAISLNAGRLSTCNVVSEKRYGAVAPLLCNQGELRQVFVNLVANALDAMSSGGGRLLIRVRDASDPISGVPGVRITFADTGSGMSAQTHRVLFEPFYTTKGSTGTGLGLWVSSQIIARHKGRILVRSSQSSERHGTVFSIFLPRLNEMPSSDDEKSKSQGMPLPINGNATSPEGASRHTPAEPGQQSAAYTAA
jgi:PAS domain S-box-containing protein